MRQTSQISKFTSLRAGFAAISIFALTSISGLAIANDAPAAAPAAEAPACLLYTSPSPRD